MECFFQDWNKETKDAKLNNIAKVIISFGNNGADVVGLSRDRKYKYLRSII